MVSGCIKFDLLLHPQAITPLPAEKGTRSVLGSLCCVWAHIRSHGSKNPLGAVAVQGLNNLHSYLLLWNTNRNSFSRVSAFYWLYRATRSLKNEMKAQNTVIYKYMVSTEAHFIMWITVKETRNNNNNKKVLQLISGTPYAYINCERMIKVIFNRN